MKKSIFITTLLIISSTILNGCMITWPIVDDLDHYKKWDTYENIRGENNNEEIIIEKNTQKTSEHEKETNAIKNCVNSRNNDPLLYEDKSVVDRHNQFENTEDFCAEFIKVNPMFYNDVIWINEI